MLSNENTEIYNDECKKCVNLADEYIYDELDGKTKADFENHINKCEKCRLFLESERSVVNTINEYGNSTPNISEMVMNTIIENKMIADKPVRKIKSWFAPSLIPAAVAVIAVFFVNKYGMLNNTMSNPNNILMQDAYIGSQHIENSQQIENESVTNEDQNEMVQGRMLGLFSESDDVYAVDNNESENKKEYENSGSGNRELYVNNALNTLNTNTNSTTETINTIIVVNENNSDDAENIKMRLMKGIEFEIVDYMLKTDMSNLSIFMENATNENFHEYLIMEDDTNSEVLIFIFENGD